MSARPSWGVAPIRCGRTKCKWRGHETDLEDQASKKFGVWATQKVCPTCGCDSYMLMTEREIAVWERKKVAAAPAAGAPP